MADEDHKDLPPQPPDGDRKDRNPTPSEVSSHTSVGLEWDHAADVGEALDDPEENDTSLENELPVTSSISINYTGRIATLTDMLKDHLDANQRAHRRQHGSQSDSLPVPLGEVLDNPEVNEASLETVSPVTSSISYTGRIATLTDMLKDHLDSNQRGHLRLHRSRSNRLPLQLGEALDNPEVNETSLENVSPVASSISYTGRIATLTDMLKVNLDSNQRGHQRLRRSISDQLPLRLGDALDDPEENNTSPQNLDPVSASSISSRIDTLMDILREHLDTNQQAHRRVHRSKSDPLPLPLTHSLQVIHPVRQYSLNDVRPITSEEEESSIFVDFQPYSIYDLPPKENQVSDLNETNIPNQNTGERHNRKSKRRIKPTVKFSPFMPYIDGPMGKPMIFVPHNNTLNTRSNDGRADRDSSKDFSDKDTSTTDLPLPNSSNITEPFNQPILGDTSETKLNNLLPSGKETTVSVPPRIPNQVGIERSVHPQKSLKVIINPIVPIEDESIPRKRYQSLSPTERHSNDSIHPAAPNNSNIDDPERLQSFPILERNLTVSFHPRIPKQVGIERSVLPQKSSKVTINPIVPIEDESIPRKRYQSLSPTERISNDSIHPAAPNNSNIDDPERLQSFPILERLSSVTFDLRAPIPDNPALRRLEIDRHREQDSCATTATLESDHINSSSTVTSSYLDTSDTDSTYQDDISQYSSGSLWTSETETNGSQTVDNLINEIKSELEHDFKKLEKMLSMMPKKLEKVWIKKEREKCTNDVPNSDDGGGDSSDDKKGKRPSDNPFKNNKDEKKKDHNSKNGDDRRRRRHNSRDNDDRRRRRHNSRDNDDRRRRGHNSRDKDDRRRRDNDDRKQRDHHYKYKDGSHRKHHSKGSREREPRDSYCHCDYKERRQRDHQSKGSKELKPRDLYCHCDNDVRRHRDHNSQDKKDRKSRDPLSKNNNNKKHRDHQTKEHKERHSSDHPKYKSRRKPDIDPKTNDDSNHVKPGLRNHNEAFFILVPELEKNILKRKQKEKERLANASIIKEIKNISNSHHNLEISDAIDKNDFVFPINSPEFDIQRAFLERRPYLFEAATAREAYILGTKVRNKEVKELKQEKVELEQNLPKPINKKITLALSQPESKKSSPRISQIEMEERTARILERERKMVEEKLKREKMKVSNRILADNYSLKIVQKLKEKDKKKKKK